MAELKISELEYLGAVTSFDTMEIPIDNGQNTYRITVEDFNERGTTSAQNQAAAAAASAADALEYKNAAATSESNALSYKNSAVSAKESAESAAVDALAYKNAAQSAANDAEGYRDTMRTATATTTADVALCEAAANDANTAKGLAQSAATSAANSSGDAQSFAYDSEAYACGTMGGYDVPDAAPQHNNNAKYYSQQAASSANDASNSADAAAASASAAATYTAKAPYIGTNGHWYVWDATNNQYVDTNVNATGDDGKGIVSTTKTSTSGKVDTYTILYTDGTTDTFTVTNGEDGQGSGDMLMTDYDHDQDVFNAGGIPAYVTSATTGKADKVSSATSGNLAALDSNGNITDSGVSAQSVTGKMNTDGTNAANLVKFPKAINVGPTIYQDFPVSSMAKDSGDNQPLVITVDVTNGFDTLNGERVKKLFAAWVNNTDRIYIIDASDDPSVERDIVIDSVSNSIVSTTTYRVTVNAHFKVDFSDAFEAVNYSDKKIYLPNKSKSDGNVIGTGSVADENANAEGLLSYSYGAGSHSEGLYTGAYYAHAEGEKTYASGEDSHAEGLFTTAGGDYSHVEGNNNFTGTSATASSVTGTYNKSEYANQHVSGKYNSNKATTLLEVGNGTANNARSNAFEVYDDGSISQNNGTDKYKFAKSGGLDGFYDGSGNFHPFEPLYLEQSVTLSTSADTTVTFTNAAIATTSRIDPYTSDYTVVPTNVVATTGSCTVTFKKVSTAVTITVGIEVKN